MINTIICYSQGKQSIYTWDVAISQLDDARSLIRQINFGSPPLSLLSLYIYELYVIS